MAVNSVNDYANKLYDILAPIFRQWIGQNIITQQKMLKKIYEKDIPSFPESLDLRLSAYYRISDYSISVNISTYCQNDDGHAVYADTCLYLANLRDKKLISVYEKDDRRTNYTLAEVEKNREQLKLARQNYEQAKEKLHPFGIWYVYQLK